MLHRFNAATAGHNPTIAQAMNMMDLSVAQMRSLSPLPEDAQRLVDQAVVRVGLDRLTVVADLLSEGLTYPLDDPLGVTEITWDSVGETGGAQRTMNPEARGENQLPARTPHRIPVFLTTDDFFMGIRTLRVSQRIGLPLDTTLVEQATRRVNEAIEDQAINGAAMAVNGNSAPGILNAPNVNVLQFGDSGRAWTHASKTGANIYDDVSAMIDSAQGERRWGPYNLYTGTSYGNRLNADYKAEGDESVLGRLQRIQAGGRALRVRVSDQMPADTVALVQMTRDVIDLVDGQAPVVVPWTSPSGFTLFWLVMAIQIVRVKTDFESRSGIVVSSTAAVP